MTTDAAAASSEAPARRSHRPAPPAMTEQEADRLRSMSSDDPIALPEGRLGCASCGVATAPPSSRAGVIYADVWGRPGPTGAVRGHEQRVPLGLCEACSERAHRALSLAAAHPALIRALGQARAIEAAEGVLIALDLLGAAHPPIDVDDKRLGILIRNLGSVGLGLRWSQHIKVERLLGKANPYGWAHVRASDRLRVRTANVHAAADRLMLTRGPVKVAPPEFTRQDIGRGQHPVAGGCGICGIGHVEVPPERVAASRRHTMARQVWALHAGVGTQSVGAAASPVTLTIWLCPACEEAAQRVGAMGPSALERALFTYLGTLNQQPLDAQVPGLIGWAGLHANAVRRARPVPTPNRVPWDHLDLSRFTEPDDPVPGPAARAQVEAG